MKRKFIAVFVGLVLVGVLGANNERLSTFFLGTKQERFNKAVSKHISVDLIGYKLEKTEIKKGKIIKKVKQEDMVQTLKDEILKMVNS